MLNGGAVIKINIIGAVDAAYPHYLSIADAGVGIVNAGVVAQLSNRLPIVQINFSIGTVVTAPGNPFIVNGCGVFAKAIKG